MFDVTLIDEILLRNLTISLFKSASLFMDEIEATFLSWIFKTKIIEKYCNEIFQRNIYFRSLESI